MPIRAAPGGYKAGTAVLVPCFADLYNEPFRAAACPGMLWRYRSDVRKIPSEPLVCQPFWLTPKPIKIKKMTRKEFMEQSLRMGVCLPFLPSFLLPTFGGERSILPQFPWNFSGKVLVIGAGAAGLSAAYLLKQYGIDFLLIEAAPVYGGRLKKINDFADFPLDLGAEWIHTHPRVLSAIRNDPKAPTPVEIMDYHPQTIKSWHAGKLNSHHFIRNFYREWKFASTTWFDFFEQFIVPTISDRLVLRAPVSEINYENKKVRVTTQAGEHYEADKVLLTSSIKTLQQQQIAFVPALPLPKTRAINRVYMGEGMKLFIEFRERFYPDILVFDKLSRAMREENKILYDAAFRKDSDKHILGLFAINEKALAYTQLKSEAAIVEKVLIELDEIFAGKASANYVKHVLQNWSEEPFIQGAYSYSFDGNRSRIVAEIKEPVRDRIYFAGEALSLDHQATVHGACESARAAVAQLIEGPYDGNATGQTAAAPDK